ncbi:hypothetical protein [Cryobacterium sp. CG_9.6]|uniref:hypothetical protein n=1 Tax=Cryobacterium sp. CG_9.6 TaxID=2760710 RepID=UPI002474204F|nr:hypothetical protein [Cryobacterium sp. CG_9.6]MDH6236234.1 hypothetical protein [Cryobacterium sp. CG_9.6]
MAGNADAEWAALNASLRDYTPPCDGLELFTSEQLSDEIFAANPLRLAAGGQWIEVAPEALGSQAPEGVIAEVRERVFQQLIDAGVPGAVRVRDVTWQKAGADGENTGAWITNVRPVVLCVP